VLMERTRAPSREVGRGSAVAVEGRLFSQNKIDLGDYHGSIAAGMIESGRLCSLKRKARR
jgi:hypothetical protein